MTVTEKRDRVSDLIARVDDEFFTTVYPMLETYVRKHGEEVVGYRAGKELTKAELGANITKAENQIEQGAFLTAEELEKDTEAWLSNTK